MAHDDLCAQLRWVRAADHITAWFTSHALRARPALKLIYQTVPYIPDLKDGVLRHKR